MRRVAMLALMSSLLLGCGRVRMRVVDAREEIIERQPILKPAEKPVRRARLEGGRLIATSRTRCALSEQVRILRTEKREGRVAVLQSMTLFGLALGPLVAGTVVLADSGSVYDKDRNSRLYNKHGQSHAVLSGALLTVAGGLLAMPAIIHLVRSATARDTRRRIVVKMGPEIESDVACAQTEEPLAPHVGVVVGPREFGYQPKPGQQGRSEVDLLELLPDAVLSARARQTHPTATVLLDGEKAVEIPLHNLSMEKRRRSDHAMWEEVAPRCGLQATESQCAGVRSYLKRFPDGEHRQRAKALLSAVAAKQPQPKGDPEVVNKAKAAARQQCLRSCQIACRTRGGTPAARKACTTSCQEEACP